MDKRVLNEVNKIKKQMGLLQEQNNLGNELINKTVLIDLKAPTGTAKDIKLRIKRVSFSEEENVFVLGVERLNVPEGSNKKDFGEELVVPCGGDICFFKSEVNSNRFKTYEATCVELIAYIQKNLCPKVNDSSVNNTDLQGGETPVPLK